MVYSPALVMPLSAPPPYAEFERQLCRRLQHGARPVSYFARRLAAGDVELTAVIQDSAGVSVLRGLATDLTDRESLTPRFPALHIFEREIFEQTALPMPGHPWLKPVRSPVEPMDAYPFFDMVGKEIHQVAVGPIHAGVIEPGHFRFHCHGETVHHLEIQLGYQHRGIETLVLQRPLAHAPALVESIAGDTVIGHSWAFCRALEALANLTMPDPVELVRGVALELERIAMHLSGLSGIATDIGFLQGSTTWGRLRTSIINMSMLLCGSRFGRGWLRPGGVRFGIAPDVAQRCLAQLQQFERDMAVMVELFHTSLTVNGRLHDVGTVTAEMADQMGLVGMAARSSGLPLDLRTTLPGPAFRLLPIQAATVNSGDCWARAELRIVEIGFSLEWLRQALQQPHLDDTPLQAIGPLAPNALGIGLCEAWRGEVLHTLQTDGEGQVCHFKAQDPSLRNWFGLAQALRGNEISDFPICNKSFDLSYCGSDL